MRPLAAFQVLLVRETPFAILRQALTASQLGSVEGQGQLGTFQHLDVDGFSNVICLFPGPWSGFFHVRQCFILTVPDQFILAGNWRGVSLPGDTGSYFYIEKSRTANEHILCWKPPSI